ncbi:MAG: N-6 DNA methylase [Chloroflexi bacterium]|nr:N-6 DNA methylase [Chloroflexota bacterium]
MVSRAKTRDEIIDLVFKDPEVKHGLKIFAPAELGKLNLSEESGKFFIKCPVSDRKKVAKPEEIIRQLAINKLTDDLHYPTKHLAVEVPIKMGSTYASKNADVVVYKEDAKQTPYIIVEVKKPLRKDGLEQLHSYMNATGVYYGAWINGNDAVYLLRAEPNLFETLKRLPAVNEDLDDVKTPIRKSELEPIHDLKEMVLELENTVLANAGVSAFDAILPLIFAKLRDEIDKGEDDTMEFRITTASPQDQYQRLEGLFRKAKAKWPDIFGEGDRIELTPEALVAVASAFQTKKFFDTDLDVIDAAFEYMINPEQKGDKGQFFTPRQVVKMCVKMLNPKPDELALDPACGPCGFMIHSLNWVTEHYLKSRYGGDWKVRKVQYANSNLFAIDFDPRLARVAKAMMLIAGDGRTNVYRVNSLDPREWKNRTDGLVGAIYDGKFDVVMTNPPFAGSIAQPEILGSFDLAYKGDSTRHKRVNRLTRDVLFIERCLRFIKPGGRMAIVSPQGNLNNTNADYIREFMANKARVLAMVGLHVNTFKPFTGTKTSVILLQKWRNEDEITIDYPVFMAASEKPGKDSSGDYVFKKAPDGSYLIDENGKQQVDHDLDDIGEAFIQFARDQGLDFWRG